MDHIERLRRLALHQVTAVVRAPARSDIGLESSLDARTTALLRLGALVAVGGGSGPSYGSLTDSCLSAGASVEEIIDVLLAILPITGPVRVAAAAAEVAMALGYDIDDLPDTWP